MGPRRLFVVLAFVAVAAAGDLPHPFVKVSPAPGATGVPLDEPVTAELAVDVGTRALKAKHADIRVLTPRGRKRVWKRIGGSPQYDTAKKTLYFKKRQDFEPNTEYRVTVLAERQTFEWTFTTGTERANQAIGGDRDERRFQEAKKRFEAGDWQGAEGRFRNIPEEHARYAEARYYVAEVQQRLSRERPPEIPEGLPGSMRVCERLMEALTADRALWEKRFSQDPAFGISKLKRFVAGMKDTDPKSAAAWQALAGQIAALDGELDDARFRLACDAHRMAVRVGGNTPAIRLEYAVFLYFAGRDSNGNRCREFRRDFEGVAADPAASPEVKARAHYFAGRNGFDVARNGGVHPGAPDAENDETLRRSEKHLRDALGLRREYPEAELVLGWITRFQGRRPLSNSSFERALEYEPGIRGAHLGLHRNHKDDGKTAEAKRELELERRLYADPSEFWLAYARVMKDEHEPEAELSAYFEAARAAPGDAELWRRAGMSAYERQDYERALEGIAQAVERGARSVTDWSLLAELQKRTGRDAEARRSFEEALKLDPGSATIWRSIRLAGQSWGKTQTSEELLAVFRDLLERFPESAPGHAEAGFFCALLERRDDAAGHYIRALDRAKGEAVYANLYELADIIGSERMKALRDAILMEEPRHSRLEEAVQRALTAEWEAEYRRQKEREARMSFGSGSFAGGGGGGGYCGLNYNGWEVDDAMREWESQTAGTFGALGIR